MVASRRIELPLPRSGARLELELDRGRCYRVIADELTGAELMQALADTGLASLVAHEGGLLGNLNVWENLSLPAAWRGRGDRGSLAEGACALFAELGIDAAALCRSMPEELSTFETKAACFVRSVLVEPEVMVFDRLTQGLAASEATRALRFQQVFATRFPFRTSVFIDREAPALSPPGWHTLDLRAPA